jgi:peptidoglycan/LPS O-acetylase OafA/YrhL
VAWGEERFSYQPALDGVRGLAVAFVLAFHLGVPWATGGYLGVSVFFTLSGFLITSLLLAEHEQAGRIDIRAFYLRRARRLAPAALVCIGGVTALLATGVLQERTGARAEVFSATFEAANWHALLAGQSYADLFLAPSALAHFWSLAIEEQFYVVWPVTFAALAAWAARRRRRSSLSTALVTLFIAFAVLSPVTARWWSADAAYYASWARFGEILAGAALASLLARRTLPARAGLLAPLCLAAIVGLCATTPAGTGWAYAGGLPIFALLSAGLIAGVQVDGPVRSALGWHPLVALGVISYGVYLFHWPVFLVLDEQRTGLDGLALGALRVAVTLALARTVFAILERPVRARVLLARPSRFLMSAGAAVVVVAVAVLLTVPDLAHSGRRTTLVVATQPTGSASVVLPPSAQTVAVFGDSVPDWLLRDAASAYKRTDFIVVNEAHEGCDGDPTEPMAQGARGEKLQRGPTCRAWSDLYPAVVENSLQRVDIALLMLGQAPVLSHFIDGQWVHPCDDMRWYSDDVEARIVYMKQHVRTVVLALPSWADDSIRLYLPADHETRYGCVRDRLREVALRTGVQTIDLADVLCPSGPTQDCPHYRQRDGMHVDPERAPMVLDWILDQLPGATQVRRAPHIT